MTKCLAAETGVGNGTAGEQDQRLKQSVLTRSWRNLWGKWEIRENADEARVAGK